MMDKRYSLVVAGLVFLLAGCAVETNEMKTLREQVRMQQKQIVDLNARQEEHQAKIEILDNGFKILSDKAEDNAQRLGDMELRGPAMPAPSPIISAPAEPSPAAPVQVEVPKPSPAPEPPAEKIVVPNTLSAADLYRSALDNFTRENYQRSVLEFEEFVANHSDNDLADNAQYWIGECYYAQKSFEQAVIEFDKVVEHFSSGNKAPAALLKKGLALRELDKMEESLMALERVISKYPASEEAGIAERRLSQWR